MAPEQGRSAPFRHDVSDPRSDPIDVEDLAGYEARRLEVENCLDGVKSAKSVTTRDGMHRTTTKNLRFLKISIATRASAARVLWTA
jgi:hypothetical protein